MTRTEALSIPELQIHPDGLVEDCFYYRLAMQGRLSDEQGRKALERLKGHEDDPCYKGSFIVADMMIQNLDRFGVACIDWCQ
ncbi:MAG: hypothetical protein IJ562_10705 [Prevotella sp.]|nr:hypothetical protein [Prevotella sp.]